MGVMSIEGVWWEIEFTGKANDGILTVDIEATTEEEAIKVFRRHYEDNREYLILWIFRPGTLRGKIIS